MFAKRRSNVFGGTVAGVAAEYTNMAATTDWAAELAATDAPTDRPRELLDVRTAGPPDPMVETLETLPELPAETLLVQVNDRAPQHLYPKLDDRGYRYATVERGDAVVTGIWRP
jgi:TusA-related sulfurtransferase